MVSSSPAPLATRVVGIGASAGGLAALEEFLGSVTPGSGLAYIVVQHLDPTHRALLAELLQRVTEMPVREASRNQRVEPNCVYVIPPDTEMSLVNGALNLKRPYEPRGMRLPINVLFSSLASDLGERAIAVVLSGMGSDGTMGLQAVKAAGGLTAVQQPETAQFDMMPKSAIAAGCGDIIAPPAQLPVRILAYVAKVPDSGAASEEQAQQAMAPNHLNNVFRLLQARTRQDFSLYKPSTLHRRIERRMAIHSLATLAHYTEFLRQNPQEIDLLFKELLIGVTSFFRDPAVWEHLAEVALPELLARRTDKKLRAWSIGCSTGEEAYSLAMVFTEVAQRMGQPGNFSLQIFASDLSPDAIATARGGRYPLSIASDVSAERLARFFTLHENHYQIKQNIRDMVLFAQHDVVLDPPFTKLDLISCRNLLIYFDAVLQRKLLPLFRYSLLPSGLLLLGTSETVGKFNAMFTSLGDRKLRVYLRSDSGPTGAPDFLMKTLPRLYKTTPEFQLPSPDTATPSTDNLQAAADQTLLQLYAPAAVVLNSGGDIVYISGRTGKYLEPAAGKANWNFHAMVREGLRAPLGTALKKAAAQREPLLLHGLQVQTLGGPQFVDVQVQAMQEPQVLRGMTMIVFRDIAPAPTGRGGRKAPTSVQAAHTLELQRLGDEIQTLREDSRASKEELQSANEELQSTNEELQSTNEELTTSKEEMQSMNEELQTINAELQGKLDDLALAQSDMQNLLNSTEIAILFLDQHLNVRRYTERASKIVNVRESDVGRPLSDLTTTLQYPALHQDALETLRTMAFSEKQIPTNDNRWFSVRILPYRRLDNVIDGVVITFVDITATKQLESALRKNS
ncbi:MAG: chemotaxis protein CheB [Pseudomonadota bacterium]